MNFVCKNCMVHFSLAGKVALKYDFISLRYSGFHFCFLILETNKFYEINNSWELMCIPCNESTNFQLDRILMMLVHLKHFWLLRALWHWIVLAFVNNIMTNKQKERKTKLKLIVYKITERAEGIEGKIL